MNSSVMPTYARMPVSFVYGQGAWLFSTEERRYLDAISGIAVCNLGHAHPKVARAIADQASKLVHTSNLYGISLQETLADHLTRLSGLENAFFCNSGAEANEAALKIARRYGHHKGIAAPRVVVMERSFHGRTLATLSASGNPRIQDGFEPLVEGFVRVPYNDLAAVAALNDPDIAAILVEPVQGEGGVRVPAAEYLPGLRAIADQRGWLLMLDEVQTGMGRARRDVLRQGHRRRLPAGRGLRQGTCGQAPEARHAWHDLWRRSAGLRGRQCRAGCGARARLPRGRRPRRAPPLARAAGAWRNATPR